MANPLKNWTILIYANGNNELEPEIWSSILQATQTPAYDSLNIIAQVGRCERKLVQLIRPFDNIPSYNSSNPALNWQGVRRYSLSGYTPELLMDLHFINMADPRSLLDFLHWSLLKFPAYRYMLILAGHGASFIGALPDLSQSTPYLMGIPELCSTINSLHHEGQKLDILIMDICYINLLEVMYELGAPKDKAVSNVLTYIESGPLQGLSYKNLINYLSKTNVSTSTNKIIIELVALFDRELVAVALDTDKLHHLKKLINSTAFNVLQHGYHPTTSLDIYLKENYYTLWKIIQNAVAQLIITSKSSAFCTKSLLEIVSTPLSNPEMFKMYKRLKFAHNNKWCELLNNTNTEESENSTSLSFKPLRMTRQGLKPLIKALNPIANKEITEKILTSLISYKNWYFNK